MAAEKAPPWDEVLAALNDLRAAKDRENRDEHFGKLDQIIRSGASSAQAQQVLWTELQQVLQDKARLAAVEQKRRRDHHELIDKKLVGLLVTGLMTAAREEIKDQEVLRRVNQRWLALLPKPASMRDSTESENE
jgi:hypothetical protein